MRRLLLVMLLSVVTFSCSQVRSTQVSTSEPIESPIPIIATSTEEPTLEATSTIYPPELDLTVIGDERELDSFILEITDVREFDSPECVDETQCIFQESIGYIRQPLSMFRSESSNYIKQVESYSYLLEGILYRHIPAFLSYPSRNEVYMVPHEELISDELDTNEFEHYPDTLWGSTFINSAQFLAQSEYEGIPANHFIVDETNLSAPIGEFVGEIQEAEGEIYISLDGKYLYYVNLKLTGEFGSRELTRKLTSINQINEFTLPVDFPEVELDPGFPLPDGVFLFSYDANPDWGADVSKYDICMPSALSPEGFLAFYQDLPETNGWIVNDLGGPLPGSVWYGLYDFDMVKMTKGEQQVYIYPVSYGVISPPTGCVFATAELHQ